MMIGFFQRLFAEDRKVKLDRLIKQATQMDELLIAGKIAPDTRQQLQAGRDDLERQIRLLMSA
jgi:hypothetical protein